jgi:DNA-binding TFAR19-related protein (PDSD5 family)
LKKETAEDVVNQVIKMLKNKSFYSIQLDESINVSNRTLLLCVIRVLLKNTAEDIENQVIKMVKSAPLCSIQLDESINVSNKALLACIVRVEFQGELQEELLCSLNLLDRTTSFEILKHLIVIF